MMATVNWPASLHMKRYWILQQANITTETIFRVSTARYLAQYAKWLIYHMPKAEALVIDTSPFLQAK